MKYLVQCPTGLQDLVAHQLTHEALSSFQLVLVEEGFVVFESKEHPGRISSLPYVNNCFTVVKYLGLQNDGVEDALHMLMKNLDWLATAKHLVTPREQTFRISVSDCGKFIRLRHCLRSIINLIYVSTNMRFSPRLANVEFWLIRRRSGHCYFTKRLSYRRRTEKDLQRGELRPELSHLICMMSEPTEDDIFLDPFAGSGALLFARRSWPFNMMFASDVDEGKLFSIKTALKASRKHRVNKRSPIIVRAADARSLDRFKEGFIHKIVTDPPWGLFDKNLENLEDFYRAVMGELVRILADDGILVLLLGEKALARKLVQECAQSLRKVASYNILVNGRPAIVLKWRRIPRLKSDLA